MAQKISLEALAIVETIERRGSFARAAEELEKATSALSYTVQKLEEQLGVTLFQRQGRNSVLTPAGRLLVDEGRKLLIASNLLADRVKELSDGWEPRIRVAIESTCPMDWFFQATARFLQKHPSIEVDVIESVLSGGWEALEFDQVELLVGGPGSPPQHKGIRTLAIEAPEMILVASKHHPVCNYLDKPDVLEQMIGKARRVITHDTAKINVVRSAGLMTNDNAFYVQNVHQKIEAQLAAIGIGHLPRSAIQAHLDSGELVPIPDGEHYSRGDPGTSQLAWKISNKGKGLKALVGILQDTSMG